MRSTSCSYHLFHNKTPLWLPAWPHLFPKSSDIILLVDNGLHQFKVNMVIITVKLNHSLVTYQITFIVTSPQHMCLVSEILKSMHQTVQKQFTYRQYILTNDSVQYTHTYTQYTQCTFTFMHLADAFIQSDLQCIQFINVFISMCILLDILTVINTHNTPYEHILHYVHIYIHTIICEGAKDYT